MTMGNALIPQGDTDWGEASSHCVHPGMAKARNTDSIKCWQRKQSNWNTQPVGRENGKSSHSLELKQNVGTPSEAQGLIPWCPPYREVPTVSKHMQQHPM